MKYIKRVIYFILNMVTLGRGAKINVSGVSLRFPVRYMRYFPRDYEIDNFNFLREKSKNGDVIIDIGAHFGIFSICAARAVGPQGSVFAFEPTPSTFNVLKEVIALNKFESRVTPVRLAVSDGPGKTQFYIGKITGDVGNSLVNYNDGVHEGYDVELTSLDIFCREKGLTIGFLKIDAEGAELSVLQGATGILTNDRPYCILSMHPASIKRAGESNERIWDFIQQYNYEIQYNSQPITKDDFISRTDLFDVQLLPGK